VKYVHCVITLDNALHCIIKYTVHQVMSGIQLRRKGMGSFKYVLCKSEKLNGWENCTQAAVHSSVEEIIWGA